VEKVLAVLGFACEHQKGSHRKFNKDGHPSPVILSYSGSQEIPKGTFGSILKQMGLKTIDFYRILREGASPVADEPKPEAQDPPRLKRISNHWGYESVEMETLLRKLPDEALQVVLDDPSSD